MLVVATGQLVETDFAACVRQLVGKGGGTLTAKSAEGNKTLYEAKDGNRVMSFAFGRADTVVLGVGATMSGDVYAREVVIGGSITGNIHATERVELQATAIVTGDVLTQTILVQEGGVVNGRVLMRPPEGMDQHDSRHVNELATSDR